MRKANGLCALSGHLRGEDDTLPTQHRIDDVEVNPQAKLYLVIMSGKLNKKSIIIKEREMKNECEKVERKMEREKTNFKKMK